MIIAPCPKVYVVISVYCRIVDSLKKQVAQFVLTASHFFRVNTSRGLGDKVL